MAQIKELEKIMKHDRGSYLIGKDGHLLVYICPAEEYVCFTLEESGCERYYIENINVIYIYKNIKDWFFFNYVGYTDFAVVRYFIFDIEFKYLFIDPRDKYLEVVIK